MPSARTSNFTTCDQSLRRHTLESLAFHIYDKKNIKIHDMHNGIILHIKIKRKNIFCYILYVYFFLRVMLTKILALLQVSVLVRLIHFKTVLRLVR